VRTRLFTVQEANALLPTLERVLEEVRQLGSEMERRHEKVQLLDALWGEKLADPATPDHPEFADHRDTILRLAGQVEEIVQREIVGRGVRFPQGGIEHGLLDFPTLLDGRTVYLCWQAGEPEIEAWHEVDGGFRGRQPLTPELAARMGQDRHEP
jgi:hypothetical protein